jgi:ParB-like chromosome segregation protein Spo0J
MPARRVDKAASKVKVPKRKLRLRYVPIAKLRRWKNNPRRNDKAAENLLGLFEEYGFIDPIIATPDNVIRAGHTRLKAATKTDLKELPVIFVDFGSEDKASMYALSNNRASEWAEWDEDLLADTLSKRRSLPDELMAKLSGFEVQEIEGLREGFVEPEEGEPTEPSDEVKVSFTFTRKQAEVIERAREKLGSERLTKKIIAACRRG